MLKLLAASLLLICQCAFSFDKVVIWGHKLHTHTHSYIHYGFFKGFKHLGYKTYWFDNNDDVRNFDFSNSLFITEWQAADKMPIRDDCFYVLHNCKAKKFKQLIEKGLAVNLQVFREDFVTFETAEKVEPFVYHDLKTKTIFMPWATDLLPDEIEKVKKTLPNIKREKKVFWIGTIGEGDGGNRDEIRLFQRACEENGIAFIHNDPWSHPVSAEENLRLIQISYMAPAIVGNKQKKLGYIPCRIFKNISYGQMGMTNSKYIAELFEGRIVYHQNPHKLFYEAKKIMKTYTLEQQYEVMDFVRDRHTYLNRIETLLQFIEKFKKAESDA